MRDVHQRATDAVRLGEHIAAIAVLWLAIVALGWIALLGDDIRAWRANTTVERLDLPEHDYSHEYPANLSRCDMECIKRIEVAE